MDPTQLTDDNICTKLDTSTEPEILGFSKKVSATGLSSLYKPQLHEHSTKLPKEIWDQSYFEEYMGLHEILKPGNIFLKNSKTLSDP